MTSTYVGDTYESTGAPASIVEEPAYTLLAYDEESMMANAAIDRGVSIRSPDEILPRGQRFELLKRRVGE